MLVLVCLGLNLVDGLSDEKCADEKDEGNAYNRCKYSFYM
jgi:hypothetical protein